MRISTLKTNFSAQAEPIFIALNRSTQSAIQNAPIAQSRLVANKLHTGR